MLRSYSISPFALHRARDAKRPKGRVRETQRLRDRGREERDGKSTWKADMPWAKSERFLPTDHLCPHPPVSTLEFSACCLGGDESCFLELDLPVSIIPLSSFLGLAILHYPAP